MHVQSASGRPDGHSVSVSDAYFVAHYAGAVHSQVALTRCLCQDGLETTDGAFHAADIILKCIGFEVNEGIERLCGRSRMASDGMIDTRVWAVVEPHLDEAANLLPLVGHVSAIHYFSKSLVAQWTRVAVPLASIGATSVTYPRLVRTNYITASEGTEALLRSAASDPAAHKLLSEHVEAVAGDCHASWSPETYVESNAKQWELLNDQLSASSSRTNPVSYPFTEVLEVLREESPSSLQTKSNYAKRRSATRDLQRY
jgi:hypothetical protein